MIFSLRRRAGGRLLKKREPDAFLGKFRQKAGGALGRREGAGGKRPPGRGAERGKEALGLNRRGGIRAGKIYAAGSS